MKPSTLSILLGIIAISVLGNLYLSNKTLTQLNEIEKLTVKIDSLRRNDILMSHKVGPIHQYPSMSQKGTRRTRNLIGIDDQTAYSFVHSFTTATEFIVPVSWEFEHTDVEKLLGLSHNSLTNGLRFYAGMVPGDTYIHLVAIPTDANHNDVFRNQGAGAINAYEFARLCPVECDNNNSLLHIQGFYGWQAGMLTAN